MSFMKIFTQYDVCGRVFLKNDFLIKEKWLRWLSIRYPMKSVMLKKINWIMINLVTNSNTLFSFHLKFSSDIISTSSRKAQEISKEGNRGWLDPPSPPNTYHSQNFLRQGFDIWSCVVKYLWPCVYNKASLKICVVYIRDAVE